MNSSDDLQKTLEQTPAVDTRRRNFLRGRISSTPSRSTPPSSPGGNSGAPTIAHFLPHCLALQGVLCRTCSDRCDHGAIVFQPQIGGMFTPSLREAQCTGCGDCLPDCPTHAIQLQPVTQATPHSDTP